MSDKKAIVIDLGCGGNKFPGSIGMDQKAINGVDVAGQVDALPFGNSVADEVIACHVLEHVPSLLDAVEEIWRICKPGARVRVWSPHFSCGLYSWGDPTHVRTFSTLAFDYFSPDAEMSYYSTARFRIAERRLHFAFQRDGSIIDSAHPMISFLKRVVSRVANPLANLNRMTQLLCERVWASCVGFEEVYFELECVKEREIS